MTIYRTLLAKGYLPKELPPAFFTEQFARYATTRAGRAILKANKHVGTLTDCVRYELALPGGARRPLRIPHPVSFARLAYLVAESFKRLLTKAAQSPFSRSRPVYASNRQRAIQPSVSAASLGRERLIARGASRFLLKVDVSQYYPSLYTHAVGWAIDPKLRNKANWKNTKLLGKKLDQALMNLQGKTSQGIPIGNDVSFLLGEVVLAQVDQELGIPPRQSYRWFDDYEVSCATRGEAERHLATLERVLERYHLRINPQKTKILELPSLAREQWQSTIIEASKRSLSTPNDMVHFFDSAFSLREDFPDAAVMTYALGVLFRLTSPNADAGRVAQSAISQAILAEPGSSQKAFALLTYWALNGLVLDAQLLQETVGNMVLGHKMRGVSSDLAWALSFCIDQRISLSGDVGNILGRSGDDCIILQALHMKADGLLPDGWSTKPISKILKDEDLDGQHWLLAYETVRSGVLADCAKKVAAHPLFSDLLAKKVTFYRSALPRYAMLVHPGGMPEWVIRRWLDPILRGEIDAGAYVRAAATTNEVAKAKIVEDAARVAKPAQSVADLAVDLLDIMEAEQFASLVEEEAFPYG